MSLGFGCLHTYQLTLADTVKIGDLIFANECNKKTEYLVFWNPQGENFPSLGICHCIWAPVGVDIGYEQTFPALCAYLQEQKVVLPGWLVEALKTGAPWKDRDEFVRDTQRTEELRSILRATISLQTSFMIMRLDKELVLIMQQVPHKQKKRVQAYIDMLTLSARGWYALVDYLNFKGSGLLEKERVKGCGWGLLQVLLDMPDGLSETTIIEAFCESAIKVLTRRVKLGDGHDAKFLNGWIKRLNTYSTSIISTSTL
jgi:hypothetical protein